MNDSATSDSEADGQPDGPGALADDQVPSTLEAPGMTVALPSKSPMFEAHHSARYLRQQLIRQINHESDRHLICMVAGVDAFVEREDILAFSDLLHHVPQDAHIDFMLHTVGGDTDVAEKIAGMLWARIGKTGTLRIIVPDFAKSAGTLISLAADEIVMSDTSELGPIDPQVVRRSSSGKTTTIAVQHYLDAYRNAQDAFRADPEDPVAIAELTSFNPETIVSYKAVVDRARALSDKHLSQGMFRRGDGGAYTAITGSLLDTRRWRTHGQVIDHRDAKQIGLNVDYRAHNEAEWQAWWRLHCLQRLALPSSDSRLFESAFVCLPY